MCCLCALCGALALWDLFTICCKFVPLNNICPESSAQKTPRAAEVGEHGLVLCLLVAVSVRWCRQVLEGLFAVPVGTRHLTLKGPCQAWGHAGDRRQGGWRWFPRRDREVVTRSQRLPLWTEVRSAVHGRSAWSSTSGATQFLSGPVFAECHGHRAMRRRQIRPGLVAPLA